MFQLPAFSRHCLLAAALLILRTSCAAPVTMTVDHWTGANTTFANGVLEVSKGSAELKDLVFQDGTIEFDMFMPDHGILGLRLRARDRDNAEALYFRPQKACATSVDCMQYMPLEHGAFEWDLFPEGQAPAPLRLLDWNHVKVVVAGQTMRVWINGASAPTLAIDHMEGSPLPGALLFGGPAKYAHLVITPAAPAAAAARTAPVPQDGFLRHWQLSTAAVLPTTPDAALQLPTGVQPAYAGMPPAGAGWKAVTAQAKGLINFSHETGSGKDPAVVSVAWAKTTLVSDHAQSKTAQFGFVREAWVYVNGELVFAGRNIGDLPAAQADDGRISLRNGTFQLPLKAGNNEIAIALDDNLPGNMQHFGWGMELKLTDMAGVAQER